MNQSHNETPLHLREDGLEKNNNDTCAEDVEKSEPTHGCWGRGKGDGPRGNQSGGSSRSSTWGFIRPSDATRRRHPNRSSRTRVPNSHDSKQPQKVETTQAPVRGGAEETPGRWAHLQPHAAAKAETHQPPERDPREGGQAPGHTPTDVQETSRPGNSPERKWSSGCQRLGARRDGSWAPGLQILPFIHRISSMFMSV